MLLSACKLGSSSIVKNSLSSSVSALISEIERATLNSKPVADLSPISTTALKPLRIVPLSSAPSSESLAIDQSPEWYADNQTDTGLGVQYEKLVNQEPIETLPLLSDDGWHDYDDETTPRTEDDVRFEEAFSTLVDQPDDINVIHYAEADRLLICVVENRLIGYLALNDDPSPHEFSWSTPTALSSITEAEAEILRERGYQALVRRFERKGFITT